MAFCSRLKGNFSDEIRLKGTRCHEEGRVEILGGTSRRVAAMVNDDKPCLTVLEWQAGTLNWACTCHQFGTEGPCKHLWAAGLAAEGDGYLTDAPAGGTLPVHPDVDLLDRFSENLPLVDDKETLDDVYELMDELLDAGPNARMPGPRGLLPVKKAPRDDPWRKFFAKLHSSFVGIETLLKPCDCAENSWHGHGGLSDAVFHLQPKTEFTPVK